MEKLKIVIGKKELPTELQWVKFFLKLKERGYKLKFHYRIRGRTEVFDSPLIFSNDVSQGAPLPVIPELVKAYKPVKTPSGRTRYVLGAKFYDVRSLTDPDAETSLRIFNLCSNL